MSADVNADHRETLERIFRHPAGGNVEWRRVRSLLEAVGDVTEEHNGKLKVRLGDETEVFRPPHGKDVDDQLIVDLRRMLRNAGIVPAG
jgi:hypothetical protein